MTDISTSELTRLKAVKPADGTSGAIKLAESSGTFAASVRQRAGNNLNKCLHCRTCAGGCPFSSSMDYKPNEVIRLVQLGLRRDAFQCGSIWVCVGCHTCAVQCPMGIDIASVMDAVRQLALAENAQIAEPNIHHFHREVMGCIERYGRTHKLEIMMRYKMKSHDWFTDMMTGLKMLMKGKLELRPSKIEHVHLIKDLFDRRRVHGPEPL
jgi:heterodisulfide reductase subunit C